MATPFITPAFVTGEISPNVYGRIDLDREHIAATTMRNLFVSYKGGANSRAGTQFCGFSKQTGRNYPPRLIPFQFSLDQGLVLEFGQQYMRALLDGAYVTESPVGIGGATQANPAVLTFGAQGATAATPIVTGVTFSYAPGDLVTLLGGTFLTPAVLSVTASQLVSLLPNAHGTGYAVNDTVTLAGGTFSVAAVAKVTAVAAYAAAGFITFSVNPSDGDTVTLNGVAWTFKTTPTAAAQTQIQPTLAGTLAQLAVDLNASANASLTVATYSSTATTININYDTTGAGGNAYTLAASVAVRSGATLTGGTTTGISTLSINTAGVYTALPAGGNMTQSATSGGGAGASFQTAVFGPQAVTISNPGAYTAVPANPVAQDTTTGSGLGATFTMTFAAVAAFNNGDWIFVQDVQGMTELNGNTFVVAAATATTVALLDVYGNPVDSSAFGAYTGGGTASRIYTLPTIYNDQDLAYLKYVQSADVMTLCCVNPVTRTEYPPQDLARISDTAWTFTPAVSVPSVSPPASSLATATAGGTTYYAYEVTAVSPDDGTESIASPIAYVGSVNISTVAGQVIVTWPTVPGVNQYNVYKAQPGFGFLPPVGSLFGYMGSAYGNQTVDNNIIPDFAQVPPRHVDPFARGRIISLKMLTGGAGYTSATAVITSATGSGAKIDLVLVGGAVVAAIVEDTGSGYLPTDTVAITGTGAGATAQLVVGPQSGTYPSVPGYFQERRVFADTLNLPDTYFMSQPGAFRNFDSRIPTIDTDAIIGSPWSLQVNGIQWLIQTSGGLLVMTGSSAWLLAGAGSFATNVQPISPSTQDDVPQAFTGVSPIVQPIKINYDVIYVNSKGSYYYALPYQLYVLSEPIDLSELSAHLFQFHVIKENAWCEQPSKLLWAVRDDGILLSLTYYKTQAVAGWARHDTNGYFVSVCSITEPPIDALYVATKRNIGGNSSYMVERMDHRLWASVDDVWAVDAGLSLPQPTPNGTLTADLPNGIGAITGVTGLIGGANYAANTTAAVVDNNGDGTGTGAIPTLTIVGGVITAVTFAPGSQGTLYTSPKLVITDPTNSGSGASATCVLDTTTHFMSDTPVFDPANIGDVIRMGGGIATITVYHGPTSVDGVLTDPITAMQPDSGGNVIPQPPGSWTMTTPVSVISGLDHLIGGMVTGVADGQVITPRVVSAAGSIALDAPASNVVVGLGFRAQLQGVYLDAGAPSVQGARKKMGAVNVLLDGSRDVLAGGAQPDGSTQSPPQLAPRWRHLTAMPNLAAPSFNSAVTPLYTGYNRAPVTAGFNKTGQFSLQQNFPLPMNIDAVVSEVLAGDTPEQMVSKRGQRGQPQEQQ